MMTSNNDTKSVKVYAYVGTWSVDLHDEQNSEKSSGGIHVFLLDQHDGSLIPVSNISGNVNAGYMCISSDQRFLYSVDERKDIEGRKGNGGGVCSYAIDPESGSIRFINNKSSLGAYPCFITVDAEISFVFVSNHGHHTDVITRVVIDKQGKYQVCAQYDEGSITMLPIKEDGSLGDACDVKVLTGKSVDTFFQSSPHPHSVNVDPTNKFVIVCDKGTDRIITYRIDFKEGKMDPISPPFIITAQGSGPRHLAFHPTLPYVFINNEINSTVSSYLFDKNGGGLTLLHTLPTIPSNYVPEDPSDQFAQNATADIQVHPNGNFFYVSNRGHNSIAGYRIDGTTGEFSLIGYTPSQGAVPRAISFDPFGTFLFVANQRTNNIVPFFVDPESGILAPTGSVAHISNPVCIKFTKFPG